MRLTIMTAALAAGLAAAPAAAVNFGTGTYTENFNTLGSTAPAAFSTLPAGFRVTESGNNADTTYSVGTGSGTTGDTYSFGSTNSTDRALGSLTSGNVQSTIFADFTNNTGSTVTALTVGYTGEMWRLGQITAGRAADRLDFAYSINGGTFVDFNALDFSSPVTAGSIGALDGNAAANRTVLSSTLGNLSLANGSTITFRWTDLDLVPGSDDGLAIDDFNLTPTLATAAVPEPATWGMMLVGFGLLGAALRRRPAVASVAA